MADKMATRAAYGKALVEMGAENPNLVVMDADLSMQALAFAKASSISSKSCPSMTITFQPKAANFSSIGFTVITSSFFQALVEMGAENPNLVVMDADLSKSTMTAEFSKTYPDRFFNMGISAVSS